MWTWRAHAWHHRRIMPRRPKPASAPAARRSKPALAAAARRPKPAPRRGTVRSLVTGVAIVAVTVSIVALILNHRHPSQPRATPETEAPAALPYPDLVT